jgi:hypothetical protein
MHMYMHMCMYDFKAERRASVGARRRFYSSTRVRTELHVDAHPVEGEDAG